MNRLISVSEWEQRGKCVRLGLEKKIQFRDCGSVCACVFARLYVCKHDDPNELKLNCIV